MQETQRLYHICTENGKHNLKKKRLNTFDILWMCFFQKGEKFTNDEKVTGHSVGLQSGQNKVTGFVIFPCIPIGLRSKPKQAQLKWSFS